MKCIISGWDWWFAALRNPDDIDFYTPHNSTINQWLNGEVHAIHSSKKTCTGISTGWNRCWNYGDGNLKPPDMPQFRFSMLWHHTKQDWLLLVMQTGNMKSHHATKYGSMSVMENNGLTWLERDLTDYSRVSIWLKSEVFFKIHPVQTVRLVVVREWLDSIRTLHQSPLIKILSVVP